MKRCNRCGETKPRSEFHRNKTHSDGLCSHCKPCTLASGAAWRAANPETVKAKTRRYYEANADEICAKARAWREDNIDRARAASAARHRADPSKQAARSRRWYEKNREQAIAQAREWNREHPEQQRERVRRRRARIKGAAVERVDYVEVLERHGTCCYLCLEEIEPGDLDFDHVVPIARSGEHSMANVRPTHARCNRRKGARLVSELDWTARRLNAKGIAA